MATDNIGVILLDGRLVTLVEALAATRARWGVAPGEPVYSSERPPLTVALPENGS